MFLDTDPRSHRALLGYASVFLRSLNRFGAPAGTFASIGFGRGSLLRHEPSLVHLVQLLLFNLVDRMPGCNPAAMVRHRCVRYNSHWVEFDWRAAPALRRAGARKPARKQA